MYEGATAETVIDTLMLGTKAAAGDGYEFEETSILELGDADREAVIDAYGDQLDGWEELTVPSGSIGRAWSHDDQRFVVMIVDIDDVELVITVASTVD